MSKAKKTATASMVGREKELSQIETAIRLKRNLLIEGPVGVGKTYLILRALEKLKLPYERVDGDTRYTEQKLTGWFDPPLVLKKGYGKESFIAGPLMLAMQKGHVLFVNELNRMPEAVQNILLPAMDEKKIILPKIGEAVAKDGFVVIATQNPSEFTATHSLSEALLDRFEMIRLHYQDREEELEILNEHLGPGKDWGRVVDIVRSTRNHPSIKRGASLRAALAIGDLMKSGLSLTDACRLAVPSRIELLSTDDDVFAVIDSLISGNIPSSTVHEKKKTIR